MLQKTYVRSFIVISQARDTPRAIWSFERVGLRALPWPTPRTGLKIDRLEDFLPSTGALDESFYALHELIGGLYYRMRYLAKALSNPDYAYPHKVTAVPKG